MAMSLPRGIARLVPLSVLLACGTDTPTHPKVEVLDQPLASSLVYSEWSPPVKLGPEINSSANEQNATLSKDGLSLYFTSNRGTGVLDIYVSRRASVNSPFSPAQNLGSPVNSGGADFAPNLSIDGHLLFFSSNRGGGSVDIYVSHREDKDYDFGWSLPVKLGSGVNTEDQQENAPMYLQSAEAGSTNLYFNRG